MTQNEKSILLKDLCARLPYRVKCFVPIENLTMELTGKRLNYFCFHKEEWGSDYSHELEVVLDPLNDARNGCVIKPYLRPMSSMTEEEEKELHKISNCHLEKIKCYNKKTNCCDLLKVKITNNYTPFGTFEVEPEYSLVEQDNILAIIDYLNSHYFDYHGLIEKGLAIKVTEKNNPYKE